MSILVRNVQDLHIYHPTPPVAPALPTCKDFARLIHRISTTCKVFKVPVDNLCITFKVFISGKSPLLKSFKTFKVVNICLVNIPFKSNISYKVTFKTSYTLKSVILCHTF